ncbi:VOC family protein [Cohnella nanjingensis]|uniref:VOC family protein n=1 Tax=Cohnella nanjingensis TaxID=1387779 RepID=A0A7X0RRQ3_9BACL|nr:VOC family protein [Cohnella nanjingensis]MBB6671059.1 VOC family protein [Cohnella nanjingensis]
MLQRLEHMQIPVRNLDRAIGWYRERLGFRQNGGGEGQGIAFLTLPEGPMLMLWETADEGRAHFTVNGVDFPVLLYRTDRIHELHRTLTEQGTSIQCYQNEEFGWVLKFYDPDGNLWGALQMNEEAAE